MFDFQRGERQEIVRKFPRKDPNGVVDCGLPQRDRGKALASRLRVVKEDSRVHVYACRDGIVKEDSLVCVLRQDCGKGLTCMCAERRL